MDEFASKLAGLEINSADFRRNWSRLGFAKNDDGIGKVLRNDVRLQKCCIVIVNTIVTRHFDLLQIRLNLPIESTYEPL